MKNNIFIFFDNVSRETLIKKFFKFYKVIVYNFVKKF